MFHGKSDQQETCSGSKTIINWNVTKEWSMIKERKEKEPSTTEVLENY